MTDADAADQLQVRVGEMLDRPALGFISMLFIRNTEELLATYRRLSTCASDHGLQLEKVYVQRAAPPDTVFDLLGSLLESDDLQLVVPTLTHLVALGNPIQIRDHLRSAGHEVVIAIKPAERAC